MAVRSEGVVRLTAMYQLSPAIVNAEVMYIVIRARYMTGLPRRATDGAVTTLMVCNSIMVTVERTTCRCFRQNWSQGS